MIGFFSGLLFFVVSFLSPTFGPPTFCFVGDTGGPREDERWNLVGAGRCSDILGNEFDAAELKDVDKEWSFDKVKRLALGRPYVVGLSVDQNRLSALDVLKTAVRIRASWDSKKQVIVVFRLERWSDGPHN